MDNALEYITLGLGVIAALVVIATIIMIIVVAGKAALVSLGILLLLIPVTYILGRIVNRFTGLVDDSKSISFSGQGGRLEE